MFLCCTVTQFSQNKESVWSQQTCLTRRILHLPVPFHNLQFSSGQLLLYIMFYFRLLICTYIKLLIFSFEVFNVNVVLSLPFVITICGIGSDHHWRQYAYFIRYSVAGLELSNLQFHLFVFRRMRLYFRLTKKSLKFQQMWNYPFDKWSPLIWSPVLIKLKSL